MRRSHRPSRQISVDAHARPQAPQFAASKRRSTHAPHDEPHTMSGGGQPPNMHVPPRHGPHVQRTPHAPQLFASLRTPMHAPSHSRCGAAQCTPTQVPPTQTPSNPHAWSHRPQWRRSVFASTQTSPHRVNSDEHTTG